MPRHHLQEIPICVTSTVLTSLLSLGCGTLAGAAAVSTAYRRLEAAYQPPADETLGKGMESSLEVAIRTEALTFARYRRKGVIRLLLVESYVDGVLRGVQVARDSESVDPVTLFEDFGYEALEGLKGEPDEVRDTDLLVPFDGTSQRIAIGENYPKHAAETATEAPDGAAGRDDLGHRANAGASLRGSLPELGLQR